MTNSTSTSSAIGAEYSNPSLRRLLLTAAVRRRRGAGARPFFLDDADTLGGESDTMLSRR
jgi:hypothetical protein